MKTTPRTLTVIIPDGNPRNLQKVVGNADCVMMVVSRAYCERARLSDVKELSTPALYILTDDVNKVYIGQAKQFAHRVIDHLAKKAWWTKAYVFVSDSDRFHASSIEYLEYLAIRLAQSVQRYDCSENRQIPSNPTLPQHDRPKYDEAFEEICFFLNYERCYVFESDANSPQPNVSSEVQEPEPPHLFFLKVKGCEARGIFCNDGTKKFVVLQGSEVVPTSTPSFKSMGERDKFLKHCSRGKGGIYLLDEDYTFSTPSGASACCGGRPSNGWTDWRDADGRTLKQYLVENK